MGDVFLLPEAVAEMVHARNKLRDHYAKRMGCSQEDPRLKFQFDGNLVGDIGEALAVEYYGIVLDPGRSTEGVDGHTADGKNSVQVKATGTGRGPVFRNTSGRADYLLFFELDFERASASVVFNGPESIAKRPLPKEFSGQRSVSAAQIRAANLLVKNEERLIEKSGLHP